MVRVRQTTGVVDYPDISALHPGHLAKLVERSSGTDNPFRLISAQWDRGGGAAQIEHPGCKLKTQLMQIRGASAAQQRSEEHTV